MLFRERCCIRRVEYQKELEKIIQEIGSDNVVYLDESGFDGREIYKESCWCSRGKEIFGERTGNRFKRRKSLLLAKRGKNLLSPLLFEGTCNKDLFNEWLEKMLLPELKSYKEKQVIIMDNASIHKNKKTREILEKAGHILLYLPPYSPDYNPIEKVFGTIKRMLKHITGATLESVILSKC